MPLLASRSLWEQSGTGDVTVHVNGIRGNPGIGAFHIEGAVVVSPPQQTIGGGYGYGVRPVGGLKRRPRVVKVDGVSGRPEIGDFTLVIGIGARSISRPRRDWLQPRVSIGVAAAGADRGRRFATPHIGLVIPVISPHRIGHSRIRTPSVDTKFDLLDEEIIALISEI